MSLATGIKLIIDKLTSNTKQLFLVDGLGAFLTAFFLVVILARYEGSFGMPGRILYFLSFVAGIYAVYSFICYFFILSKWRPYLKAVAIANIIYCCLTIGLVGYFYQSLTTLGVIYFFLEVIIMSGLILIELIVISKI